MTIELPHKDILDRVTSAEQVKLHFSNTMELLREITNYGPNLIPRAFVSSERKIRDIVIIGAFLKQAVTMLDAIEVLVSQGAVYAAFLQARALFEIRLYLTWIFEADTDLRTKQFFVYHKRDLALWARRTIPGEKEYEELASASKEQGLKCTPSSNEYEARNQLEVIEQLLSSPEYLDINNEFDRLKLRERSHDVVWYRLWDGPKSISGMARRLKLYSEYLLFYNIFSKATHCQEFQRHVSIEKQALFFEPIRHLDDIEMMVRLSLSYGILIYHMILAYYRKGEWSFRL